MPAYTIIISIREPLFPQSLISSNFDISWMEINFPIHKTAIIKNTVETELENQLPKPNSQARLSTQRVQRSRTTTRHFSSLVSAAPLAQNTGQLSGHYGSTGVGEWRHFLPQLWGDGGSSPGAATVELLKLL